MAKVSDIIFCLKATNNKEHGVVADRVVNVIHPEYIPGLFTFSIIVMLVDYDVEKEHTISLSFSSPSNEEVVKMDVSVNSMQREPTNIPIEYQGITFAVDCNNVNFKSSGLYKLTFTVDGEEVGEKEILVMGKNE